MKNGIVGLVSMAILLLFLFHQRVAPIKDSGRLIETLISQTDALFSVFTSEYEEKQQQERDGVCYLK